MSKHEKVFWLMQQMILLYTKKWRRHKKWWLFAVPLMVQITILPAQAINLVGEAFLGRTSLPVYYANPLQIQGWLHRNNSVLLRDSIDYQLIKRRVNARLSTACALGRFNQIRPDKYIVVARRRTTGREIVVLGYVHSGGEKGGNVNLHDPDNLAKEGNYLIQYDRSGRCKVFIMDEA